MCLLLLHLGLGQLGKIQCTLESDFRRGTLNGIVIASLLYILLRSATQSLGTTRRPRTGMISVLCRFRTG